MDEITREIKQLLDAIPHQAVSLDMKNQMEHRPTRKAHFSELMKLAHRYNRNNQSSYGHTKGCHCQSCEPHEQRRAA